jgi:hypothetical protein
MHIITTIFFAETQDSDDSAPIDERLKVSDLKNSDRRWVSIYEGKNRVEPIDQND